MLCSTCCFNLLPACALIDFDNGSRLACKLPLIFAPLSVNSLIFITMQGDMSNPPSPAAGEGHGVDR